jgi:hypothetical protein
VFFVLGSAVKRRIMHELRHAFSRHPIYRKIVPFIQQQYVFKERPQFGIVIKTASATPALLSADHFVGTIVSHVMLATAEGRPGQSIEWVREDVQAVKANGDVFPSPPGVYFVEILKEPEDTQEGRQYGSFKVDVFLTVHDERVLEWTNAVTPAGTQFQLAHTPAQGTVFVSQDRKWPLTEGTEYEIDYTHGTLTLLRDTDPRVDIFIDYRWFLETRGPFDIDWNTADNQAIPGVVMAFGRRVQAEGVTAEGEQQIGDKQAIVVTGHRVEAADEYGGQTEISVDFDVIARDPTQMEEVADLVFFHLWAERRLKLADDGLVLTDFSLGGEVEESYDETEQTFYYNTTFSMTVRTDWAIFVPKPLTFRHISYMSQDSKEHMALLNDEQAARLQSELEMDRNLGLTLNNRMHLRDRTWNYESIA